MGFNDKLDKNKLSSLAIKDPREIFTNILRQTSGSAYTRELKYNIFYKVYAFRGITQGVGTSTLVANVALAIAQAGLTVCVIDTSILNPVQDVLLNTSVSLDEANPNVEVLDWFDMPYTRKSVLHVSKVNKNVSVLSFKGKGRTVVDFLSTNDSAQLVEIALTELNSKFDIILIDACDEMSAINTTCLQMSQQVIQVWNDTPIVLSNLETFITNSITLSCPLDKMRFVVYSKMCKDAMGSLDELIKQYRLKHIATSYLSEEVNLLLVTGKTLFQYASSNKLVIEYTNCVIDIACHILNIHNDARGTITSQEIMDGEVEGTYHKDLKDFNETFAKNHPEVQIDTNPGGAFKMEFEDDSEEEGVELSTEEPAQDTTSTEPAEITQEEDYDAVLPEHEVLVEADEQEEREEEAKREKRRGLFGRRKK